MVSASAEELALDIADVEALLAKAERPKVRTIITDYLHQLRAEQATLRSGGAAMPGSTGAIAAPVPAPKASTASPVPAAPASAAPAAAAPAPAPVPVRAPVLEVPMPAKLPTVKPEVGPSIEYTSVASFGWDQDSYGTDPNYIYVYVTSGVDGVGAIKDRVTCDFGKDSFDLKVNGLNGKNLRLLKRGLEKDIVAAESKCIVKKNQIKIKMLKKKGQYGYESWTELTAKRSKTDEDGKEKDPSSSLMDMMKDLYDNGDDSMRKTLGEAMMKSRQKQEMGGSGLDDLDSMGPNL